MATQSLGKMRRRYATQWEAATNRPYLYAGPGRGANIATWTQAARAEHVASLPVRFGYGMTLFDLVKAFDHVPWHLLVQEAIRLGYNLWVIRLSIAAYQAPRMIRINGVLSRPIIPRRSLAAGSGLATTEMRVALINLVDRALNAAPQANPVLYVDDLSVEVAGTDNFVVSKLCLFSTTFCRGIHAKHMQISNTKT